MSDTRAYDFSKLIEATLPHSTFSVLRRIGESAYQYKKSYYTADHTTRPYYETAVKISLPDAHRSELSASLRNAMAAYVDDADEFASGLPSLIGAATGAQSVASFLERILVSVALFGVQQTVDTLFGWLAGEPARYMYVYGLKGLSLEGANSLEWCDGVRFVKLPSSSDKMDELIPHHLRQEFRPFSYDRSRPDVLLCCDATAHPVFGHPENNPNGEHRPNIQRTWTFPISARWPVAMDALSLACDSCVYDAIRWQKANDDVTRILSLHGSSSCRPYHGLGDTGYSAEFTAANLREAVDLADRLQRCDNSALRVCIHRWKASFTRQREDQLIDLRIALEALYAQGTRSESKLRVAINGAWHLGKDASERRTILEQLGTLYDEASGVVHGRAASKRADCEAVRSYCRRGILKMLREGAPDWKSLIVGA